ncbi:unnamed protein product [Oppiella nova]|uniref:C2H2-type domain-containing protein n=1 Tax=Oppiella nova TaxID=334625 RepID=A0A7R9QBH1_9ACAR|nr:unnamed protein product [Oppiella nova]CAG2161885.1 unnamed protein product [Oppiella nova]
MGRKKKSESPVMAKKAKVVEKRVTRSKRNQTNTNATNHVVNKPLSKRRTNTKNNRNVSVLEELQTIELENIETEIINEYQNNELITSVDTEDLDITEGIDVSQFKQCNQIVAKKSLPEPVLHSGDNDGFSGIVLEEMVTETEVNSEVTPKKRGKRKAKVAKDSVVDNESETVANNNKSLPCLDCGLEFPDMHSLVVHEVTAHEDKGYRCHVCEKVFTRKYHLDRHLQLTPCSGQPPPAHPCEVCGKVYTRKDNLREHLRVHAGEVTRKKKFKCAHCPKMFHGASLLRIHSLSLYICIHSGKQFIQAGGLKAHLFYHTGQNGFKCEFCSKIFNRKARLQMHTRYVHDKDRPFECTDCGKKFTRKEDLNRHYVLHTGEKPHQCPTCLKRYVLFSIKPSLKLHLLTHTKEEPRSCHECGRAFIRKDCLLRHMRKRHRDLLDKILMEDKDDDEGSPSAASPGSSGYAVNNRVLSEQKLCDSIRELLSLLVDEATLKGFGWPDAPVDELLEAVIKRCGHTPVKHDSYSYYDRLRENSKLLFTVVIDDNAVKTLLNNQTVDEVILHVLRLAKS